MSVKLLNFLHTSKPRLKVEYFMVGLVLHTVSCRSSAHNTITNQYS